MFDTLLIKNLERLTNKMVIRLFHILIRFTVTVRCPIRFSHTA